MGAAHPPANRLLIVNRSSEGRQVKISPWGEVVPLAANSQVTVDQAVAEASYFEIDVWDMGIFVHAWPTIAVEVSTASGTVSLDPQTVAPQSTSGGAVGWPGASRDFVRQYERGTVAGFFITDSRPSVTGLTITSDGSEESYPANEMTWITAVSDSYVPVLEIHDDQVVVISSHARVEGALSGR